MFTMIFTTTFSVHPENLVNEIFRFGNLDLLWRDAFIWVESKIYNSTFQPIRGVYAWLNDSSIKRDILENIVDSMENIVGSMENIVDSMEIIALLQIKHDINCSCSFAAASCPRTMCKNMFASSNKTRVPSSTC